MSNVLIWHCICVIDLNSAFCIKLGNRLKLILTSTLVLVNTGSSCIADTDFCNINVVPRISPSDLFTFRLNCKCVCYS